MNNKGFTLVEVLAVVAILGILAGVAVMEVGKYINSSRKQAYDTMMDSAYAAATNYYLENNISDNTEVTFEELVNSKHLEEPIDPNMDGVSCYRGSDSSLESKVIIRVGDNPTFEVKLYCPSGYSDSKTYSE